MYKKRILTVLGCFVFLAIVRDLFRWLNAPMLGLPLEFCNGGSAHKTRMMPYQNVKEGDNMYFVYIRYRHGTDRQTDRNGKTISCTLAREKRAKQVKASLVEMCMGMGFPMGPGIPWESHGNGNKTELGMGMGNHLSGNGNYLHSHGNLFPKVLCCDELIKLLVLYLPDVNAYCAELITLKYHLPDSEVWSWTRMRTFLV